MPTSQYAKIDTWVVKAFVHEGMSNTSSCSVYVPSTFALAFAPVLELGFTIERMLSSRKGFRVQIGMRCITRHFWELSPHPKYHPFKSFVCNDMN